MSNDTPKLDYGRDGKPPGNRAERITFWASLGIAVTFLGGIVSLLGSALSLVAFAAIIVGLVLVIGSLSGPMFGVWHAVVGVALIVAGGAVLWLLHRYDLSD